MGARPVVTGRRVIIIAALAGACVWLAIGLTIRAYAREGRQPKPIPIPPALAKARAACPVVKTRTCYLTALRHAYEAIAWQKRDRRLLRSKILNYTTPVKHSTEWGCIHRGEGAWNDATGNGYYGGLQMDRNFERQYGADMLVRYQGDANLWTPRDQMIVAERAYESGRGFAPWPMTARACGLI